MPEQIGSFFPTQVPSYTEAADIRKAFNLYHYGQEAVPATESEILPQSMAGYIRDTLAAIEAAEIGQTVINNLGLNDNLNSISSSGVYHSTASPTTLLNYPTTSRGVLVVYNSNNTTYQTYQTAGTPNNFYWRSTNFGTSEFSAWALASKDGHAHDNLYYTIAQIDNKIGTSIAPERVAVTDTAGKIVAGPANVGSTQLAFLSGLASNAQAQINDRALVNHNHDDLYFRKNEVPRLWVQATQPSGAQVGDIWVW